MMTTLKTIDTTSFEIICKIGDGSYGTSIHKAIDKNTGEIVAIQILDFSDWDDELETIQSKVLWYSRKINSKSIVHYKSSYMIESTDKSLWIIMDYCSIGSVSEIIKVTKQPLNEHQIQIILREILIGLEYLHSQHIIHRSVQASNIMIDHLSCLNSNNKLILLTNGYIRQYSAKIPTELISILVSFSRECNGIVKLADFVIPKFPTHKALCGVHSTPLWMAPEVIKDAGDDAVSDIWSVGIAAIEMATGKPPHSDMSPLMALFTIVKNDAPTLPDDMIWSDVFKDFISLCLVKDPKKRSTAKELLVHEFISTANINCVLYDWILDILPQMINWRNSACKLDEEVNNDSDELETEYQTVIIESDKDDDDLNNYCTMVVESSNL